MMSQLVKKLSVLLADSYALYLKTQNYHWHVKGPQFRPLHELFEVQYLDLANAVDDIAERILIKGHRAPATFKEYETLKTISDGDSDKKANDMLIELAKDNNTLISDLQKVLEMAQKEGDEGTINLISERIEAHEKARWMLEASRSA